MSLRYLVDTNHVSFAIRGDGSVRSVLQSVPIDVLAVSAVTIAELEYASLRHPNPGPWDRAWRLLLRGWQVMPFDAPAAVQHARARAAVRHSPIGERDLMIAAIALAHGLTVVTNNTREFERVPALSLEDWRQR
ncbi:MAG: type II toxin-antitoxin system VapC family toxin [Planctomycetota bacterium]|jgi:tRNA(fMet)-specific endonuclease VapC|nr:type II toxin-antitoxin system VapC family toxin [Planctomycetota bacterium]